MQPTAGRNRFEGRYAKPHELLADLIAVLASDGTRDGVYMRHVDDSQTNPLEPRDKSAIEGGRKVRRQTLFAPSHVTCTLYVCKCTSNAHFVLCSPDLSYLGFWV